MDVNTTKSSVLAGKLLKTKFATEQERLDEFVRAMSVAVQAAETVNGRDGVDGTKGDQGPSGQDGLTPQATTQVIDFVPPGSTIVVSGIPNPTDVHIKLVWAGASPPGSDRHITYLEITGDEEVTVHLDANTAEDGWSIHATYWTVS